MSTSPNTTLSRIARNTSDHQVNGKVNPVPSLPTELWRSIIHMAAHCPLDFDFTSGDRWDDAAIFNFKQTMATKFSLLTVSRQFNAIVSEFLFEFVYISTRRLSMSIASQKEWDRKRLWRHDGWKHALKKLHPGYSPAPRPTNVTDLSCRANVNIRYLFVEGYGGNASYRSVYNVSLNNFLKSNCCSNLVGLFVAGDWGDWIFTPATIDAIPARLQLLSWNAPSNMQEVSVLLARMSRSLERLRIRRIQGPKGIISPKMTHFAKAGGWAFADLLDLADWKMPSLTHLTVGFGRCDYRDAPYRNSLLDDFEYLQVHLRPEDAPHIAIDSTTIAPPYPTLHPIIIVCHDTAARFASILQLVYAVFQICNRFTRLKAVDVFGVFSCVWRSIAANEMESLLQTVSHSLAMPGVEVRVMS